MSIKNLAISNNWFRGGIYTIPAILNTHKNLIEKQMACVPTAEDETSFLIATKSVKKNLTARKQRLEERLLVLNGEYYEDPKSAIHQAFLINNPTGREKFSNLIAERDQINGELEQVNQELKRNVALRSFLKLTKIDGELLNLCGRYYGDEKGLLDQIYRAYKNGTLPLEAYQELY